MIKLATPTPSTRAVAHVVVGLAAAIAAKKLFGTGGGVVAGFVLGALFHEMLDAPVARAMANVGLQF